MDFKEFITILSAAGVSSIKIRDYTLTEVKFLMMACRFVIFKLQIVLSAFFPVKIQAYQEQIDPDTYLADGIAGFISGSHSYIHVGNGYAYYMQIRQSRYSPYTVESRVYSADYQTWNPWVVLG